MTSGITVAPPPCSFHLLSQILVFLQFFTVSQTDFSVIWDRHFYHYSLFVHFVHHHHNVQLVYHHLFVSVYWSRTAHSFFTTSEGVSKFDRRVSSPNLAQMSLHTIPSTCWDFLNKLDLLSSYTLIVSWASLQACTLGIGRSGISWLYHSCTWDLCLCCQDQYFCALYQSSLFQLEFSDINHFLDVGMRYIPCMYQERWQVSSSPCGQNIWGVLVVVVATLEQGTKHPIAHIEPCYEFVTHSEVCPAFAHI